MSLRISSTFDSRAFQGVLDAYKNGAKFHRLVRNSTVQSTERVKIFSRKIFALEVGLGQEEVQGENGVVANAENTLNRVVKWDCEKCVKISMK